jgi:outer membrane protein assembly factor BamE (lipoprotein component of BamABCDE complex)
MQSLKTYLLCTALSGVLVVGCLHVETGKPIDADKVSQIQKGVTTRSEVEALLGQPMSVAMTGDGRRVLIYNYYKASGTAAPFVGMVNNHSASQRLQIFMTTNNIVQDFEYSTGTNVVH